MRRDEQDKHKEKGVYTTSEQRSWVLIGAWFGTIALVGLLKRLLERRV